MSRSPVDGREKSMAIW